MKTPDFWEKVAKGGDVLSTLHTGGRESLGKELPGFFTGLFCMWKGPAGFVTIVTLALLRVSSRLNSHQHSQCQVSLSFIELLASLT